MMVAGFLDFVVQPASPWLEILAGLFGIGVGLTLDEFALWLHLEDVYWAEEGRQLGGRGDLRGDHRRRRSSSDSFRSTPATVARRSRSWSRWRSSSRCAAVVALKGKISAAVIGMFIPPVAPVAAIRLARPGSFWARRRYPEGSPKLAKAEYRKQRHDRRVRRFQDLIGGAPDQPGL